MGSRNTSTNIADGLKHAMDMFNISRNRGARMSHDDLIVLVADGDPSEEVVTSINTFKIGGWVKVILRVDLFIFSNIMKRSLSCYSMIPEFQFKNIKSSVLYVFIQHFLIY